MVKNQYHYQNEILCRLLGLYSSDFWGLSLDIIMFNWREVMSILSGFYPFLFCFKALGVPFCAVFSTSLGGGCIFERSPNAIICIALLYCKDFD